MDPKLKTALAVVIGVVIGMTMLGTAIAIPAAFHAVAFRANVANGEAFGPMGQPRGMFGDRQGMMGRGQGPRWDDDVNARPRGFAPDADGTCPNGGAGFGGMRGRGRFGPQDGSGVCPNGGTFPNVTDTPATES